MNVRHRTAILKLGATVAIGAFAALGGCQVQPHGSRAALRANVIEPDPGDRTSLSTALARTDLIGPAPAPVASAPRR